MLVREANPMIATKSWDSHFIKHIKTLTIGFVKSVMEKEIN